MSAKGDFACLDFGLAELQNFEPRILLTGDDTLDGFVLAMALAYNDIKTIHWLNHLLSKHAPSNRASVSADNGQWHGMRVQASRWLAGLTHEVLHAIAAANAAGVLRRSVIRKTLKECPEAFRERWRRLVRASRAEPEKALRAYLRDLRNTGVFHYAHPEELLAAYQAHFSTEPKTPYNEVSYVSVGPTMKATRFFFADAAAQRMYVGTADLDRLFQESETLMNELHHALAGFVYAHIKRRVRDGDSR